MAQDMRQQLQGRVEDACSQLNRYGDPFTGEIVDILEILADINDDLWHSRFPSLTRANADKIKVLLDKLVADNKSLDNHKM